MINIEQLSKKYQVRKITKGDVEKVYQLFLGNPLYFKHIHEEPSIASIFQDMKALPNGKTMQDKYFMGFFNGDELIAVMDLIVEYPNEKTIFIGLFMVESKYSGKGLGSQIINDCLLEIKNQAYLFVRLGYMETNPQAKAFWEKCGFLETGIKTHNGQGMVVVMEKALG